LCADLRQDNDTVVRYAATSGLIDLAAFEPDTLKEPVAKVLILHRQRLEEWSRTDPSVKEELSLIDQFLFAWIEEQVEQMETR
tara:strand:- start:269 stop:517 length:249 start_codon:yes stop_codon:yes gene_type:complete